MVVAVLVLGGLGAFAPAAGAGEDTAAGAPAGSAYRGLPPGPGRDAVYFTCRACHSEKQFTQQRLSREEWDALLDTMVRKNGMEPPEPGQVTRYVKPFKQFRLLPLKFCRRVESRRSARSKHRG